MSTQQSADPQAAAVNKGGYPADRLLEPFYIMSTNQTAVSAVGTVPAAVGGGSTAVGATPAAVSGSSVPVSYTHLTLPTILLV